VTVADDNRSQAKAKAQTWKKKAGTVVTKSDVESWVSSKQAAGKENPNVTGYLERQLGQGASLGSAVVNKYNRSDCRIDAKKSFRTGNLRNSVCEHRWAERT
jgi:hypothetical protein